MNRSQINNKQPYKSTIVDAKSKLLDSIKDARKCVEELHETIYTVKIF